MSTSTCVPYFPAGAPAQAGGALYARADFQPFLNRSRPHELLHAGPGAKLEPARRDSLRYRYLDTGEEVQVPNVWYNHTTELRVAAWQGEIAELDRRIALAQAQQQSRRATEQDRQSAQRAEPRWSARKAELQQIQRDVSAGARFV